MFREFEASEEVEDNVVKVPRWVEVKAPQPTSHSGIKPGRLGKIMNPIPPTMKVNSSQLSQKLFVVGNNGRPIKEIGTSMIRRV